MTRYGERKPDDPQVVAKLNEYLKRVLGDEQWSTLTRGKRIWWREWAHDHLFQKPIDIPDVFRKLRESCQRHYKSQEITTELIDHIESVLSDLESAISPPSRIIRRENLTSAIEQVFQAVSRIWQDKAAASKLKNLVEVVVMDELRLERGARKKEVLVKASAHRKELIESRRIGTERPQTMRRRKRKYEQRRAESRATSTAKREKRVKLKIDVLRPFLRDYFFRHPKYKNRELEDLSKKERIDATTIFWKALDDHDSQGLQKAKRAPFTQKK